MTEKEMFINTWEREFQTTVKVLKSMPQEKADLKPAEKSKSAKDLAWVFVSEEAVLIDGVCKGEVNWGAMQKPPATLAEVIAALEKNHSGNVARIRNLSDADWNSQMPWMVAPKQMGTLRRADVLWVALMDSIHHRGQFSVYLRIAGAKVPSIYGPTADEPWM
jgi:uncharacterized damage-inducible protein DinB